MRGLSEAPFFERGHGKTKQVFRGRAGAGGAVVLGVFCPHSSTGANGSGRLLYFGPSRGRRCRSRCPSSPIVPVRRSKGGELSDTSSPSLRLSRLRYAPFVIGSVSV